MPVNRLNRVQIAAKLRRQADALESQINSIGRLGISPAPIVRQTARVACGAWAWIARHYGQKFDGKTHQVWFLAGVPTPEVKEPWHRMNAFTTWASSLPGASSMPAPPVTSPQGGAPGTKAWVWALGTVAKWLEAQADPGQYKVAVETTSHYAFQEFIQWLRQHADSCENIYKFAAEDSRAKQQCASAVVYREGGIQHFGTWAGFLGDELYRFAKRGAFSNQCFDGLQKRLDGGSYDAAKALGSFLELGGYEPAELYHADVRKIADALEVLGRQKQPRKDDEELFVPTPLQTGILEKLDGKAMRTRALAKCLGMDQPKLYKRGGIKELKEEGRVKLHSRIGYYRPDAPPPQLQGKRIKVVSTRG